MLKIPNDIIEVEMTTTCSRNCFFCRPCMLPEDLNSPAWMTAERHTAMVDDLVECDYDRWVVYCGHGEPTMHKGLVGFIAEVKERVPKAKVALATNGDFLTTEYLNRLRQVDSICWDCYENDDTARRMGQVVKDSTYPVERFAVIDCTQVPDDWWLSRAGTGWKSDKAAAARNESCCSPTRKLFLTARGRLCLCCNDSHRRLSWDCTIPELITNPDYVKARDDVYRGFRNAYPQCLECEYVGAPKGPRDITWPDNGLSAFYPTIDKTRFWPDA